MKANPNQITKIVQAIINSNKVLRSIKISQNNTPILLKIMKAVIKAIHIMKNIHKHSHNIN